MADDRYVAGCDEHAITCYFVPKVSSAASNSNLIRGERQTGQRRKEVVVSQLISLDNYTQNVNESPIAQLA